jgi:hypothetical protein
LGSQSTNFTRPNSVKNNSTKRSCTKDKGKLKSLSKKVFSNSTNKASKNSTNVDIRNIESIDKISDITETSSQNKNKINTDDSSKISSSKVITPKSNASKGENKSSLKKNLFSSLLKRKSDQESHNLNGDKDDLIQNSPPRHASKKAKLIFQKCFQTTFNPDSIPGYDNVEVEDSGESD